MTEHEKEQVRKISGEMNYFLVMTASEPYGTGMDLSRDAVRIRVKNWVRQLEALTHSETNTGTI